jgi:hypothetical protein
MGRPSRCSWVLGVPQTITLPWTGVTDSAMRTLAVQVEAVDA